jgi:restriction system protein
MARRRGSSTLGDLIDIFALLPWWVGVVSAVIAYLVLHQFAIAPVPTASTVAQMGDVASKTIIRTLASFFQYVLPLACLIGAGVSAFARSKRKSLAQGVADSKSASSLDGMSWKEFELLVGESFRQKGYKVVELGGNGPDGGIDLVLLKGTEKFLVQCKQWKALKVGVDVVRELFGVMAAKGADGGYVVTSGKFTQDAKDFAKGRNVFLIDGDSLFQLLQKTRSAMQKPSSQSASAAISLPSCPQCGASMVKRQAKRGTNVGGAFWGCSEFPRCRGTVAIG